MDRYKGLYDDEIFYNYFQALSEDRQTLKDAYTYLKLKGWSFAIDTHSPTDTYGFYKEKSELFVFYCGSIESLQLYIVSRSDGDFYPCIEIEEYKNLMKIFTTDFNYCLYLHIRSEHVSEFYGKYGMVLTGEQESEYERVIVEDYNRKKKSI